MDELVIKYLKDDDGDTVEIFRDNRVLKFIFA